MLLQTNSYIVPRDKRMDHARLLRRFRQTLMRLGCDHFEVYEQVGSNWNANEATGRFVQIMRFRDRAHQSAVHAAEQNDQAAQTLIRDFCDLINFPYQQQQGLFAVGYYTSFMKPATVGRSEMAGAAAHASGPLGDSSQMEPVAMEPEAEESQPTPVAPTPISQRPSVSGRSKPRTSPGNSSEAAADAAAIEPDPYASLPKEPPQQVRVQRAVEEPEFYVEPVPSNKPLQSKTASGRVGNAKASEDSAFSLVSGDAAQHPPTSTPETADDLGGSAFDAFDDLLADDDAKGQKNRSKR